jgi:hypothetical protein
MWGDAYMGWRSYDSVLIGNRNDNGGFVIGG